MRNLPIDINELTFYKKEKLAKYTKIMAFCSYFHIFSGVVLLLLDGFGAACSSFENGIFIMLLAIPYLLIGYLATYSSIKETVVIIGWYLIIWFAYQNKIINLPMIWYIPIMIIGIVLTCIATYFGYKHKQIEKIEIPIENSFQNKNQQRFKKI